MKINEEKLRLRAIKSKFVVSQTECKCCKKKIILKKMWKVERWNAQMETDSWYYCKECTPKKINVINEIYSDDYDFGIAYVDAF